MVLKSFFNLFGKNGKRFGAPATPPPPELIERFHGLFRAVPGIIETAYVFEQSEPDQKAQLVFAIRTAQGHEGRFAASILPDMEAIVKEIYKEDKGPVQFMLLNHQPEVEKALCDHIQPFYQNGHKPHGSEEFIKVRTSLGEEYLIHKEHWRTVILPENLKKSWYNADELYNNIYFALEDGFYHEVFEAAQRLMDIDPNPERSYTVLGILHKKLGRLDESEATFKSYLKRYGSSGTILTNLAQVYHQRKQERLAEETLWEAIQTDPNQETGLEWWIALHYEKSGERGFINALEMASLIDGSWRPQLWLAKRCLEQKNLKQAKQYYNIALERCNDHPDVLVSISGHLGKNGYMEEMFNMVLPRYCPQKHGPYPGINLLQAYLNSGNYLEGEKLLHQLYLADYPQIEEYLDHFSKEFALMKKAEEDYVEPINADEIEVNILVLDKPIWYYGLKDPKWLIHQEIRKRINMEVGFLPLVNLTPRAYEGSGHQPENESGRLTRGIPLFLSESLFFRTNLRPFMFLHVARNYGPIVCTEPYTVQDVASIAESCDQELRYIITGSIEDTDSHYNVILNVWDMERREIVETFSALQENRTIEEKILLLENDLLAFFSQHGAEYSEVYEIHSDPNRVGDYIHAYGQLLVMLLIASGFVDRQWLWGERHIMFYFLDLVLQEQQDQIARFILLSGLSFNKGMGSDIYFEFKEKMLALLDREPGPESTFYKLSPLVYVTFGMVNEFIQRRNELLPNAGLDYEIWLENLLSSSDDEH